MSSLLIPVFFATLAAPNVVLISVDTLRADHLGVYGFHRNTTPHLDQLAGQSLLFEDAICEQPQTGPSMIAMHSSQLPRVTGAVRNGVPLPPDTPTAAMRFQDAGYETAAIVSNWNLKPNLSGLERGFTHYDAFFGKRWWGGEKHEMTADVVTNRALAWLKQRDTTKPMFFWVHYMDPHAPYKNKRGFAEQLQEPPAPFPHMRNASSGTALAPQPRGDDKNTSKPGLRRFQNPAIDPPEERYQTEVAFADQQIQRLLEALPRENTFIVFTADHGESLGNHNYWGHTRYIYQNTMHIPLFIHGPGIDAGRTGAPVRGIDIGPTLLGLAGLPPLPTMTGMDLLKQQPAIDSPRIFETYGGDVPESDDVREALATRPPRRQGIIRDGWKFIRNEDGSRELYHIAEDPAEEEDRIATHEERANALEKELETWHQQTPRNQATADRLSEEDLRMLEAQGYL